MAYFANGTEGIAFEVECAGCRFGEKSCPIAFVQGFYNYDACNNATARDILNHLVKNDGTCAMKELIMKSED